MRPFVRDVLAKLSARAPLKIPKCPSLPSPGWWCNGRGHAHDADTLANSLRLADANRGMWLEFGVWTGYSIKRIAEFRQHHRKQHTSAHASVFGFDWFHGLPTYWTQGHPKGRFDLNGVPPSLSKDLGIRWVNGLFNDTLPAFLRQRPQNASFVHVDSDLYASASVALQSLLRADRLSPGVVITFDELISYPDYIEHEMRALWELHVSSGRPVELLGYGGVGQPPFEPDKVYKGVTAASVRLL